MTQIQSVGRPIPQSNRPRIVWLPILVVAAFVVWLIARYWTFLNHDTSDVVPVGFAIALAVMLSALPLVLCLVQNVSQSRQLGKLGSLKDFRFLANTSFFETATSSIKSIRLVVDADYALPILTFSLITFFGFLAIFVGYGRARLFTTASVLLGGLQDRSDLAKFSEYQLQTFCVIAMAFIGGYVYSLSRIVTRINTNDFFPISLHFYSIRIITAVFVAAVARHTISVVGLSTDTTNWAPVLLLMGFGVGFAPDLFIVAMTKKVYQLLKTWGSRDEPDEKVRPVSLALLMIDDLTREKIDRLNELGIDSAQMLARQNPFLLLPRLPYDLGLLVDWIGQAQLYELVKDENLKKLRTSCVRDIFDLHVRLEDEKARSEVCKTLDLPSAAGEALLRQLNEDPSFLRLRQVRRALSRYNRDENSLDRD